MIFSFWMQISYMVQILAAGMLFIIPARKRAYFGLRVACSTLVWILIAYMFKYMLTAETGVGKAVFMWSAYLISAVVFIWINIHVSLLQATFCGIICCGIQHIAFDLCEIMLLCLGEDSQVLSIYTGTAMLIIYLLVYVAAFFILAKKLVENGRYEVSKDAIFPLLTMILLIWGISVMELSPSEKFRASTYNHVIYRVLDSMCCFFVLWVQKNQKEKAALLHEIDGITAAARQQQQQYKFTSETIDSINRKCHDLKHQVRALREHTDEEDIIRYLDDIENDVMIYDTALQTGNKALDTVLMEKGLFCKDHNIEWSCMVDGAKLSFMKTEDIYAIMGNALDNAVTAVMKLEDASKRVISVKIIEQFNVVFIQIQNYFDEQLKFENGLPVTTKKNKVYHGFGIKSIRHIAEMYNGTMTVQANNGIFLLQIMIPLDS